MHESTMAAHARNVALTLNHPKGAQPQMHAHTNSVKMVLRSRGRDRLMQR